LLPCSSEPFSSRLTFKNVEIKINRTLITNVSCMGAKLDLTLREEKRLRVLENNMLTRIFGPVTDEVTGGWRILHNEELHNL
jgi:hypothetical protein